LHDARGIGPEPWSAVHSHKQSFNDVEFFVVVLVKTIRQRPVRMSAQDFQQLLAAPTGELGRQRDLPLGILCI